MMSMRSDKVFDILEHAIEQSKKNESDHFDIIIGVLSLEQNMERRNGIRNSWSRDFVNDEQNVVPRLVEAFDCVFFDVYLDYCT